MAVNEQFYRTPALIIEKPSNDNNNHIALCVSSNAITPYTINPVATNTQKQKNTIPINTIVKAVEKMNINIVALQLN
jgi:hypothetical protein